MSSNISIGGAHSSVVSTAPRLPDSINHRFADQVALHADRIAVSDQRGSMNYQDLNAAAHTVALALLQHECSPGTPVAILCSLRRPGIWAILGTLQAGAFYVPIDPTTPLGRVQSMLDDSTAKIILTDSDHADLARRVAEPNMTVINVEQLEIPALPHVPTVQQPAPDDLAYVIYTSGSTGRPKGVMQNHRNVLADILRQARDLGTTPDDRYGLIFPIAFSASVCHIFGALLTGARVCLFDLKLSGLNEMAHWLRQQRISIFDVNVATFRAMAAALGPDDVFPDMRIVAPGSEPVYQTEFEIFKKHFSRGCRMQNALGTTETRTVTQIFLTHDSSVDQLVPIGWPVDGKEVLLLDDDEREVPDGQDGQIVVKSRFLSPGYWRNPEATQRAFRDSPGEAHAKLYFTGDRGRREPNGCLTHLGRNDTQVKIRGNRVEIGEIEFALANLTGIEDAAVIAQNSSRGVTSLVGFVAGDASRRPDTDALRRDLAHLLPGYMIPARFVQLQSMPVNANGKLDRLALRRLADVGDPQTELRAEPETPTQQRIHAIWQKVVRVPMFGIDDEFFDLGGDSLGALTICAEMELAFGRFIPLVALSGGATVRGLADQIDGRAVPDSAGIVIPLQVVDPARAAQAPLFCIPGIGGHVFSYRTLVSRIDGDRAAFGLQFPGLDGWSDPIDRIESLATRFIQEMRRIQSNGPYHLIGYSIGGLVVYEMARQLKLENQSCALLAVLDSQAPGGARELGFVGRLARHAKRCFTRNPRDQAGFIARRMHRLLGRGEPVAADDPDHQGHNDYRATSLVSAIGRVREACIAARETYIPVHADISLTLFRCTEQDLDQQFEIVDHDLGWGRIARGGVEIIPIPGRHREIFKDPNVTPLARLIHDVTARHTAWR